MFNSEKNSSPFLEFNKVADLDIGGFQNLDNKNVVFKNCKVQIKRSSNLISDVFYISRENKYDVTGGNNRLFSFFGDTSTDLYVPDGKSSKEKTSMKLTIKELLSYKNGMFTYNLNQKISVTNSYRKIVYKVKNIRLITNNEIAYLIYPNGMGRIYKK